MTQRTYSGIEPDENGLIFEPDLVYVVSDVREEEIVDPDGSVTVQWSFIIDERLTYQEYAVRLKNEFDERQNETDETIIELDAGLSEALDWIDAHRGGDE